MALSNLSLSGCIVGHYQLLTAIGSGAFATVYKAVHTTTLETVAIKCIEKRNFNKKTQMEAQLMRSLDHPNIVPLFACFETVEYVFLVEEYCNMDLFTAISTISPPLSDSIVHEIFLQLLNAVEYCHSQGVSHRDLKPENVLISTNHSDSTIRLADFGTILVFFFLSLGLATRDIWSFQLGCGSARYMAPESIVSDSNIGYCPSQVDVWSLGIILLNLLSGNNPWYKASATDPVFKAYTTTQPNILQDIFGLSNELNVLIRKAIHPNPNIRITVSQLKNEFICIRNLRRQSTDQCTFKQEAQLDIADQLSIASYDGCSTSYNTLQCYPESTEEECSDSTFIDYKTMVPKFKRPSLLIPPLLPSYKPLTPGPEESPLFLSPPSCKHFSA